MDPFGCLHGGQTKSWNNRPWTIGRSVEHFPKPRKNNHPHKPTFDRCRRSSTSPLIDGSVTNKAGSRRSRLQESCPDVTIACGHTSLKSPAGPGEAGYPGAWVGKRGRPMFSVGVGRGVSVVGARNCGGLENVQAPNLRLVITVRLRASSRSSGRGNRPQPREGVSRLEVRYGGEAT